MQTLFYHLSCCNMIVTNATNYFLTFLVSVFLVSVDTHQVKCQCPQKERQALLEFKAGLIDNHGKLSLWENEEDCCCRWEGVVCDNRTRHVVELDLSRVNGLGGKMMSPSLLDLHELNHLDLSFINFNGSSFPDFVGLLTKLRFLNLRECGFSGWIPDSLGNLFMLQFLNLTSNVGEPYYSDLAWLPSLQSLEYLHLKLFILVEPIENSWTENRYREYQSWVEGNHSRYNSAKYGPRHNLTKSSRIPSTWIEVLTNLPALKEVFFQPSSIVKASNNLISPISLTPLANASNSLVALDLSGNQFTIFPPIFDWLLMNNGSLSYLDLSGNDVEDLIILESLKDFKNLSYLDLSRTSLQGSIVCPPGNSTPLLQHLDLSGNKFFGTLSDLVKFQFLKLQHLDLSGNNFSGSLPNLSTLQFLKELRLNDNYFNGSIGQHDLNLPNLEVLELSRNKFSGRIPDLSSCSSLRELSLDGNMFEGELAESIGNLLDLEQLRLGGNRLEGLISEVHLLNLSKLQVLNLRFNSNLTLRIKSPLNPPFQLAMLGLANCKLGPSFPKWLQHQRRIQYLDLSSAKIVDIIPVWFWNNTRFLGLLNMSHNQISGVLPDLSSMQATNMLDLSFNEFNGTLPLLPPLADTILLSRNKFSAIKYCNKYSDFFNSVLDLSDNKLSGHVTPHCFGNFITKFSSVNLANNNLSGEVEFSNVWCYVSSLNLRNNSFTGHIPQGLANCTFLLELDFGENKFYGTIPEWLGLATMPNLFFLSLKSNQLSGDLPSSLCSLERVHVLDISNNNISGIIPKCVNRFIMLTSTVASTSDTSIEAVTGDQKIIVVWKRKISEFVKAIRLLKVIDFSSNKLSGEIPGEIAGLVGLFSLNLSRNDLSGSIPQDIGQLQLLNSLDLSHNGLSGGIPSSLSQLSHLGILDLSFNNLSGSIPQDFHMDTFEASSYVGNPRLCGPPLRSNPCPNEGEIPRNSIFGNWTQDIFKSREFYISMTIGFIIAFWGISGTLFLNKWWNTALIKMFVGIEDWLYVTIRVSARRLQSYF